MLLCTTPWHARMPLYPRPATWHPFTRLPRLACHVYRQVIKCDINAIITSGEPPSAVRAWVSCIETIHQMRTNTGVPIRDAVNLAIRTSKDAEVKKVCTRRLSAAHEC